MEHEHTLFLSSSNCIHRRCASLSCVRSIDLPWSRMHACGWMDVCIPRYIGGKEAFIVWNSAELQNCRIARRTVIGGLSGLFHTQFIYASRKMYDRHICTLGRYQIYIIPLRICSLFRVALRFHFIFHFPLTPQLFAGSDQTMSPTTLMLPRSYP